MEKKRVRENEIADVQTLDDLITYTRSHSSTKRVRTEGGSYRSLTRALERLRDMIGMDSVKKSILSQILYFLQGLHDGKLDMLHTVIQGPPGVGKTELAKIIGEIYTSIGILRSNKFVIARRSDLIGKYLGHTADKTQSVINKCRGGVLFIDEAYSLGNNGDGDSFAKECIDTLNQNLTENKHNFMCIIAGYEKSLDQCFFAANEGLQRRFSFRYALEPYTGGQLFQIFKQMVVKDGWELSAGVLQHFFEKNHAAFPNSAGDMETLLFQTKLSHAMNSKKTKRVLSLQDLEEGFNRFTTTRSKPQQTVTSMMYL